MIKKFKGTDYETSGETTKKLLVFLMQNDKYPAYGYRDIEVKERIEKLLKDEDTLAQYKRRGIVHD